MPRNKTTPICGFSKMSCYFEAEDSLLLKEINEGLSTSDHAIRGKCNCLPACNSVQYDAEISQTTFYMEDYLMANPVPMDELPE